MCNSANPSEATFSRLVLVLGERGRTFKGNFKAFVLNSIWRKIKVISGLGSVVVALVKTVVALILMMGMIRVLMVMMMTLAEGNDV